MPTPLRFATLGKRMERRHHVQGSDPDDPLQTLTVRQGETPAQTDMHDLLDERQTLKWMLYAISTFPFSDRRREKPDATSW